jgi:uncharacterized protein (TIGR02246 family)
MSDQPTTFLPAAHEGPAWDLAREQLTRPLGDRPSVRRVREEMAVRDLYSHYAAVADLGDIEGFMRFFADDCVINARQGNFVGTTAIRAHYERLFRESPNQFHVFSNVIVRLADDLRSGKTTCYFYTMLQAAGQPVHAFCGLRSDEVVKKEGEWKIQANTSTVDATYEI